MSLPPQQELLESRANVVSAYVGSISGVLVPIILLTVSLYFGELQRAEDRREKDGERDRIEQQSTQEFRRQCVQAIRETARDLTQTGSMPDDVKSRYVVTIAQPVNQLCENAGMRLPQLLIDAVSGAKATPAATAELKQAAQDIITPPTWRVFFHVPSEPYRERAERWGKALTDAEGLAGTVSFQGVENVGDKAPRRSQLRFVNEADRDAAQQLADRITAMKGSGPVIVQKIRGQAPRRTFEFWLAADPP